MGMLCRAKPGALRTTSLIALCGALAACSDGFSRLDGDLITASVSAPSNQDVIIRKMGTPDAEQAVDRSRRDATVSDQPFPGDAVATGSIRAPAVKRAPLVTREPLPAPSAPAAPASAPAPTTIAKAKVETKPGIVVVPPRRSEFGAPAPASTQPMPTAKRKATVPQKAPSARPVADTLKAPTAPKPAEVPQVQPTARSYTVTAGDTVYGIARKVGVPPQDLVRWNSLHDTSIRPGQVLVLREGATPPREVAVAESKSVVTGSVPKQREAAKRAPEPQQKYPGDDKKTAAKGPSFSWPVRGEIVSRFGDTLNGTVNDGIDLAVPEGTSIRAVADGSVVFASSLENYGKLVLIRHDGGWVSAYAHAKATKVKRGETVSKGQVVALSGQSGNADSPRLHFELRRNSRPVDPMPHLPR